VKVTRLVHEHVQQHQELFYTDKFNRKQRIGVKF
jgi:hypothetical protein